MSKAEEKRRKTPLAIIRDGERVIRIDVELPADLEGKVRKKALEEFGGRRGALKQVIVEALKKYIEEPQKE